MRGGEGVVCLDDVKLKDELEHHCSVMQQSCPLHKEVAKLTERLDGDRRAMELAADNLDIRLEHMNEIREQLTRQAAETIRRDEVNLMMEKSTVTFGLQIRALTELMNGVREREVKVIIMLGLTLVGLCGNFALQLFIHLAKTY